MSIFHRLHRSCTPSTPIDEACVRCRCTLNPPSATSAGHSLAQVTARTAESMPVATMTPQPAISGHRSRGRVQIGRQSGSQAVGTCLPYACLPWGVLTLSVGSLASLCAMLTKPSKSSNDILVASWVSTHRTALQRQGEGGGVFAHTLEAG